MTKKRCIFYNHFITHKTQNIKIIYELFFTNFSANNELYLLRRSLAPKKICGFVLHLVLVPANTDLASYTRTIWESYTGVNGLAIKHVIN